MKSGTFTGVGAAERPVIGVVLREMSGQSLAREGAIVVRDRVQTIHRKRRTIKARGPIGIDQSREETKTAREWIRFR